MEGAHNLVEVVLPVEGVCVCVPLPINDLDVEHGDVESNAPGLKDTMNQGST